MIRRTVPFLRRDLPRLAAAALAVACALALAACAPEDDVGGVPVVSFTNLADGDTVSSPLNVCMDASNLTIEASGELNDGAGHHHVIVDPTEEEHASFTASGNPIPKDVEPRYVHLGDGGGCKEIELEPGEHTLLAVVADGGHVTLEPPVFSEVTITVE